MHPTPRLLVVAALCCVAACECERGKSPKRAAQPPTATPASNRVIELPPGDPVSVEQLSKLLPREVGGYRADEPSEQRTEKLSTGGKRPIAHRHYAKGGDRLELELTDTHHTPAVRALMTLSRPITTDNDQEFNPGEVRGFPAIIRYDASSRTAIVNVLVADRFLLNVKLLDTADAQPAVDVAGSIDLAGIARLAPDGDSAKESEQRGERGGAPSEGTGAPTTEKPEATPATTKAASDEPPPADRDRTAAP
ncbi:MAG: hypothetical protein PVI30_02720 [Myxococcales bacterium]|jgi:hypothetical protein